MKVLVMSCGLCSAALSLRLQAASLGYEVLGHVLQSLQLGPVLLCGLAVHARHFAVQPFQMLLLIQNKSWVKATELNYLI